MSENNAAKKAQESKCLTVMLIPARTDTKWFHDLIYQRGGGTDSLHQRQIAFRWFEAWSTVPEHDRGL